MKPVKSRHKPAPRRKIQKIRPTNEKPDYPNAHAIRSGVNPERNERVEFVMDCYSLGERPMTIRYKVMEKYGLSERVAAEYLAAAREELAKGFAERKEEIVARLVRRVELITRRALEERAPDIKEDQHGNQTVVYPKPDYSSAIKATELQAKLSRVLIEEVRVRTDLTAKEELAQAEALRKAAEAAEARAKDSTL